MVTTDTAQTITGVKTINNQLLFYLTASSNAVIETDSYGRMYIANNSGYTDTNLTLKQGLHIQVRDSDTTNDTNYLQIKTESGGHISLNPGAYNSGAYIGAADKKFSIVFTDYISDGSANKSVSSLINQTSETWTFTLSDNTTVTKKIVIDTSN